MTWEIMDYWVGLFVGWIFSNIVWLFFWIRKRRSKAALLERLIVRVEVGRRVVKFYPLQRWFLNCRLNMEDPEYDPYFSYQPERGDRLDFYVYEDLAE